MLTAKLRKITGKQVKRLRQDGLVPAILYGPKRKNLNLQVKEGEFIEVFQSFGETKLLDLKIDGKDIKSKVLIRDIARDPVTGKILHIDFYEVDLEKKITAQVPLKFVGVAPAVKELNGVLVKSLQEVEVESLPLNLPEEIRVDISHLKNFEDVIHLKDIQLPGGVELVGYNLDEVVASVNPPRSEEELEELEEKVEEKVEEVEVVEGKEKEKEEKEEQTEKDEEEEKEGSKN